MNKVLFFNIFVLFLLSSAVAEASNCEKENGEFNIAIKESFKCGDEKLSKFYDDKMAPTDLAEFVVYKCNMYVDNLAKKQYESTICDYSLKKGISIESAKIENNEVSTVYDLKKEINGILVRHYKMEIIKARKE